MGVNVSWIWYHCSNLCAFFWWQTNPILCFSCLQKLFFLKNQNISKKNLFLVNYSLETYHLMEWRQISLASWIPHLNYARFISRFLWYLTSSVLVLCRFYMFLHKTVLNTLNDLPKKPRSKVTPPARWSDRKKLDVLHTAAFMLQ